MELIERRRWSRFASDALGKFQPKEFLDYCNNRIQGQGTQLKIAVYHVYRYLQSVASGERFNALSWVLTAPSGSGKTEFYRAIRDFFELHGIGVPVVHIDLSRITEEGFKGTNTSAIPKTILAENPCSGGIGICFLDEADKKCLPSYTSHGDNVNAAVQSNLLTLIEGIRTRVEIDDGETDFDSGLTMFVFMGAFQSVRHQKGHKEKRLGFISDCDGTESRSTADETGDSFYDDLTIQDLIDFGMQEELAGRLSQIVNFHKISKADMQKLIRCKAKEISCELGIDVRLTKAAECDLLDVAYGSLGIRRPMNIIRELAQRTVAETFFDGGFDCGSDKVIIKSLESAYIMRSPKQAKISSAGVGAV